MHFIASEARLAVCLTAACCSSQKNWAIGWPSCWFSQHSLLVRAHRKFFSWERWLGHSWNSRRWIWYEEAIPASPRFHFIKFRWEKRNHRLVSEHIIACRRSRVPLHSSYKVVNIRAEYEKMDLILNYSENKDLNLVIFSALAKTCLFCWDLGQQQL